jgi:uncharacterized membrane protein
MIELPLATDLGRNLRAARRLARGLQRRAPMNGEPFSTSEALRFGWDAFKRNIATSIALGFASLAIMFTLNGFTQAAQHHGTLSLGFTLLAQLAQIFFGFLWIRFALAVHDGRPVRTRELWPEGSLFVNYLAVAIIYGLLVTAGLILLVIPGIYLAVRYGLAPFLVADGRTTDVLGAFRESSELTRGRRGHLFLFGLAVVVLNILGGIFFGVGLLVSMPVTTLAAALVYRRLAVRAAQDSFYAGPPAPMAV